MAGVEDRVISVSFDNAKFKAAVQETLTALQKLNDSLKIDPSKFDAGTSKSISALDKLKSALKFDSSKFKSDTDATSGALGKLKSALNIDSGKFQQDTEKSVGVLGRFKSALRLDGARKGLDDVGRAARTITFDGIGKGADAVSAKVSAMSVVAIAALSNITSKALVAGGSFVKSLTIAPITGGLEEYTTNLNSIQTILANTSASGAKLKDVSAALQELNTYSDKTIYNFSQMAANIGTFTAAGVDLDTATASIKGIANLAAVSGSNSQQASTAMYQLSQAISAGRVSLQDWNSVVNAGMGGTVFQRALAQTAEKMGTLSKGSVELKGKMKNVSIAGESFRESITAKPGEQSWLTSKVLTETLKQFTGDLSDADLAAQGFSKSQIKAIQDQAKMAVKAATEVKTLQGVLDTARESAGSGWAKTWEIVFGNFGEAKRTFTALSNTINGFIGANADARNKVLSDWKELGGRKVLIDGIKTSFEALKSVVAPIKEAFRDIFPPKTGKDLYDLTVRFRDFAETLKIGPTTADNLKRSFRGLFAILDIGKQVVGGIFEVIKILFSSLTSGSGDFLNFTGNLGDSLVALSGWLREGDRLKNFFKGFGNLLATPIALLGKIKDVLTGLFDGISGSDSASLSALFDALKERLQPLSAALKVAGDAWTIFVQAFERVKEKLQPAIDAIVSAFANLGGQIKAAIKTQDFDTVLDIIQTSLLGGIFIAIKKMIGKGINIDFGGEALKGLSEAFGVLTNSLKSLQTSVQAATLLQIAVALGVLSISVVALSRIDGDSLKSAMTAIAVGMGQLVGGVALLTKTTGGAGFAKLPFIAGSLILLAVALDVLVIAVKSLSNLSWEELGKGLAGVAGLLVTLSAAVTPLSAGSAKLIFIGAGLIAVAIAMRILVESVEALGNLSWEKIGKGLAGVAGALIAISVGVLAMPPSLILIGPGLIAVGIALGIISGVVLAFGSMDWTTIGKGLLAIGVALGLIAAAVLFIPPTLPITAAGLVLVGIALTEIAGAVALMGGQSVGKLAKGLVAIGLALVILAGGLTLMIAALPGAAALLVAAGALAILVPVIAALGSMSWGTIGKGLAAIAAALLVISVVGLVAAPALAALGVGLLALGAGIALVGGGVFLLGKGLSLMASEGAKGVAVLIAALTGIILLVPKLVISFAQGLLGIVKGVASIAPQVVDALSTILIALLDTIIKAVPKLAQAFGAIVQAMVKILRDNFPAMVSVGLEMLRSLLQGIDKNISSLTNTAVSIVTKFLQAISNNMGKLTKAGVDLLGKFISGVASGYGKLATAAGEIIAKLISGISQGLGRIVQAATNLVTRFLSGIGNAAGQIIAAGVRMITRLLEGIANQASALVEKGVWAAGRFVNAVAKGLVKLADVGATAVINFLNGIANVIRAREPELIAAGANIGKAIVQGFIAGLASIDITGYVRSKFQGAINAAKGALKIKSPSRIFAEIGSYVVQGFAEGVGKDPSAALAVVAMSKSVIDAVRNTFQIQSPSKVMAELGKFVGEGFLKGLQGTSDDITNAVTELQTKLTDAMRTARETIATEEDKLDRLRKAKKKDTDAIKKAQEAIDENQKLLDRAKAAHTELRRELKDEATALKGLAGQFEAVSQELDTAKQKLEAATQARDDAQKGFSDKFGDLPDLQSEVDGKPNQDPLGTFSKDLANRAQAVAGYQATLQQLRKLGINDRLYQKLLDDGTADQQFANQLLAGGKTAVDGLNALDGQLSSAANTLATQASRNLYQAGVNSAQGIVDGLASKKAGIETAMGQIADAMVKAIKKKLKIKSPSEVFAEIGEFSSKGMAKGLESSTKVVTDAASAVGDEAMKGLRDSLSKATFDNIDVNPVVTPVLDLTKFQADAQAMGALLNVVPITAASSFGQAAAISAQRSALQQALEDLAPVTPVAEIKFEQTNNSPEALSDVEIYRQTRNLLSQAKTKLGIAS